MLPPLPKQLKHKEADFGILFRHYLKEHPRFSCAFELKSSNKDSIPFSALEEHQADYLTAINGPKGVLVRVQGMNGEPDYIYLRNFPACVVIKFPGMFHIISIGMFLDEKKKSTRKSLSSSRAGEISIKSVKL